MRRTILGPVIMCMLIIGLIGTDFGQTAQAKNNKAGSKAVATKEAKHHAKPSGGAQAVVHGKKHASHKKKATLASHTGNKHKKGSVDARKTASAKDKKHRVAVAKGAKASGAKALKAADSRKARAVDHKRLKVAASGKSKAARKKSKAHAYAHHRARSHSKESLHARSREHARPKVKAAQLLPIPDYKIHTPEPSDLYLAHGDPDDVNPLAGDARPEKRMPLSVRVLELAYRCLGIPYRHGGTTTDGFDCSGFVKYVFKENGIELRRSSREQVQEGKQVSLDDIKPGDLLFFRMHQRRKDRALVDHVGLYVGNGQFIHASSSPRSHEIKVDNLESHYMPKVVEARRVIDDSSQEANVGLPN